MDNADQTKSKSIIPVRTILISLAVIITYMSPELSSSFIYDRAAVMDGQFWRIFTSHLVHFDKMHLIYDLSAFIIAGWILETGSRKRFTLLLIATAFLIPVVLFFLRPLMVYYGGLSGLVCGMIFYLALDGLADSKSKNMLSSLLGLALVIKIIYEAYTGDSVLLYPETSIFIPMWESHAVGVMTALILFIFKNSKIRKPDMQNS